MNSGDQEKDLRTRGIAVYRAKETTLQAPENNDDADLMKELIKFLGGEEEKMVSVNRLGKFSQERIEEQKYRPLKVRFKTQEARDYVLKNLYKLKNAPPSIRTLSIRQDLNLEQRQELSQKVKEAKEKSEGLVDSFYRVKGSPGDYKLVKITKK